MPFQAIISNRQRSIPVDLKWFERMSKSLLKALLENLKSRPSKLVSSKLLDELADRGLLSLTLVSDRQMKQLNSEWRHINRTTDVLSFPLNLEAPADAPFEIGEVVISLPKAAQQAAEYGHSVKRELAFLFAHGTLHVLGFDHETKKDEKEMFGRQTAILDQAGFKR